MPTPEIFEDDEEVESFAALDGFVEDDDVTVRFVVEEDVLDRFIGAFVVGKRLCEPARAPRGPWSAFHC